MIPFIEDMFSGLESFFQLLKRCSAALRASSCCLKICSAALCASSCCLNRCSVALRTSSCCLKKSTAAQHSSKCCIRSIFCFESSTSKWLVHSSQIASAISHSFSCLCFVEALIVEEGLSLLSIKTLSDRSATTVATKSGLESKCFRM